MPFSNQQSTQTHSDQLRITSFSSHYRHKYGEAIGKIPLDLGQPCPNRALGGCIFCYPASFSPSYLQQENSLQFQIAQAKQHFTKGRFLRYFAYFQQESATALPWEMLNQCLNTVLGQEECCGVILSTRPDCLEQATVSRISRVIKASGKECLIEIGLQSMHARSLSFLNRNHTYQDFVDSLRRVQDSGVLSAGVHLLFGIPGESEDEMLTSLTEVCRLGVQALKLHHLQVVRATPLQHIYEKQPFTLFSSETYLQFLLKALPLIPKDVIIHRLWTTSHPDLLIAPRWNILAGVLSQRLLAAMEHKDIRQGQRCGG